MSHHSTFPLCMAVWAQTCKHCLPLVQVLEPWLNQSRPLFREWVSPHLTPPTTEVLKVSDTWQTRVLFVGFSFTASPSTITHLQTQAWPLSMTSKAKLQGSREFQRVALVRCWIRQVDRCVLDRASFLFFRTRSAWNVMSEIRGDDFWMTWHRSLKGCVTSRQSVTSFYRWFGGIRKLLKKKNSNLYKK